MYAHSALALKRERKKRASRSNQSGEPAPALKVTRDQLQPPQIQSYSLTYFNVGVAFTLMGTFMISTSLVPDDLLDPNWTSLIPIGCLFIILGMIPCFLGENIKYFPYNSFDLAYIVLLPA